MQDKPSYDLDEVKRLVAESKFYLTKTVIDDIHDLHMADAHQPAMEVVSRLEICFHHKTLVLDRRPGKKADVYRGVEYCGINWYVKLFIEDDEAQVAIWSCKEK